MTVGWAINGCGSSDTSWTTVLVIASSDSVRVIQTCDPGLVGRIPFSPEPIWLRQPGHYPDGPPALGCPNHTVEYLRSAGGRSGYLYLTNQSGCDSTVFITTTYTGTYQATSTVLRSVARGRLSGYAGGDLGPCDSLFITQYQYTPGYHLADRVDLPGQPGGNLVQVLPDQFGCDSTIITVMTLSPSDTTLVEGVTCNKTDEFYDERH